MSDIRNPIYQDLHSKQLAEEESANARSAARILGIVLPYLKPASVLDVGCGLGTWLKAAGELGINDIQGVEGAWLNPAQLRIGPERVEVKDLEKPFDLGRRFDLVICLEVAEHLSAEAAGRFVASLTRHGPAVLFSAAIPFQGGHHHVNEQFLPYWAALFARHGYRPLDFVRPRIWNDAEVLWWLRQNAVLFAHDDLIAANETLGREAAATEQRGPLSVVHPDVYLTRMQQAGQRLAEYAKLRRAFGRGGVFRVAVSAKGELTLSKAGK